MSSSPVTPRQPLLTVAQAAERLAVAPRTLYVWIQAGRLDCVRIGRLVRFEPSSLDRFIETHREVSR
jgi:excisionase family DNA binding protein